MAKKITLAILYLLTVVTSSAYADSFLCVAEAGAAASHVNNGDISSGIVDVSNAKFIHTRTDDKWVVKMLGQDFALFDKCSPNGSICERSDSYAGMFSRSNSGIFSVTWITMDGNRELLIVAKGRCSRL